MITALIFLYVVFGIVLAMAVHAFMEDETFKVFLMKSGVVIGIWALIMFFFNIVYAMVIHATL
jgi:hypothetical protein